MALWDAGSQKLWYRPAASKTRNRNLVKDEGGEVLLGWWPTPSVVIGPAVTQIDGDRAMDSLPKQSYFNDNGKEFKNKAEFQTYRSRHFRRMVDNMMWIILDPPEAQDATPVGKLNDVEYDRLYDEWIKSDPVNKTLAKELRKLLDLIENGSPAPEEILEDVNDKL
jgi:hypothetical protein